MWRWRGQERPPFASEPGPGQRSVWDFPRPPRIEAVPVPVRVALDGETLAVSHRALRICETASAPTYYLDPADVSMERLERCGPESVCEWKGRAAHWRLAGGEGPPLAWSYPEPFPAFEAIAGWLAFYPSRVSCFVGDERAMPQEGGFYGGWVTADLAGPIKGGPGSHGW